MKNLFVIPFLLTAFLCSAGAYAQQSVPVPIKKIAPKKRQQPVKDTTVITKGTPQKDLPDVLKEMLHSEPSSEVDSITAKPQISVVPAIGYTLVTKFAVVLSGNVAFRNGPQSRISTIVASASYTENKQFIMPVQTSFWTADNDYNFIGNYSYFKYPQSTYGLGTNTTIAKENPMNYSLVQLFETVMKHVGGNFYAGIGYNFDTHWDISQKGNIDKTVSDYTKYGTASTTISSGFTVNGVLDSRDNMINPSKGAYVGIQYRNAASFLGSTNNWNSLIIDARKYINFPSGSGNTLALWSYDWLILSGHTPYLDLPANGWDANLATGRGYIQGRFRGSKMVYGEAEYRYRITANGLIGGTVFFNAESFAAEQNSGLERIRPGYGPGLRIKLNKVSKTNISINYGFGDEDSKGLFISVGEAF